MGLENLLKYIEAITLLLPLIEQIVTMVEGLFKNIAGSQGPAKKESAVEQAKTVLLGAGVALPEEIIGGMIDTVVKVKNATGQFTHGLSQAPPVQEESPEFAK